MDNNQLIIRKIYIDTLIDTLVEMYNMGVDYVDLIGTTDDLQDCIGLSFCKEYMNEDMKINFNNISEEDIDKDIKIDKKLSEEDLNQLL